MVVVMSIVLVLGLWCLIAAIFGFTYPLNLIFNEQQPSGDKTIALIKRTYLSFGLLLISLVGAYIINVMWLFYGIIVLIILLAANTAVRGKTAGKQSALPELQIRIALYISTAVTVMIAAIIIYAIRVPDYQIDDEILKINTLHGMELPLDHIKAINIREQMTRVIGTYQGIHIGKYIRGLFEADFLGKGRVYVNDGSQPYIYIFYDKTFLIINAGDKSKTERLHKKLREAWLEALNR